MKWYLATATVLVGIIAGTNRASSQSWSLGGDMGMSLLDRASGFQLSPSGEYLFKRTMAVGTEFSINTEYATPLLWYTYFKY